MAYLRRYSLPRHKLARRALCARHCSDKSAGLDKRLRRLSVATAHGRFRPRFWRCSPAHSARASSPYTLGSCVELALKLGIALKLATRPRREVRLRQYHAGLLVGTLHNHTRLGDGEAARGGSAIGSGLRRTASVNLGRGLSVR